MIAASGRSALTFRAAMSASSAPTTIRSELPFAITPTMNCQDIFVRPHKAERARLQSASSSHRHGLVPIRLVHRPQTRRFQLQWLGVLKLQDPEPDLRSTLRRSGYSTCTDECPLSGVKRTSLERAVMSAFDP